MTQQTPPDGRPADSTGSTSPPASSSHTAWCAGGPDRNQPDHGCVSDQRTWDGSDITTWLAAIDNTTLLVVDTPTGVHELRVA